MPEFLHCIYHRQTLSLCSGVVPLSIIQLATGKIYGMIRLAELTHILSQSLMHQYEHGILHPNSVIVE